MNIKHTLVAASLLAMIILNITHAALKSPPKSDAWIEQQMKAIQAQTANINENVLRLSLVAYQKARQKGFDTKQMLTIIDYSQPSTAKRLWVIDLKSDKMLFNTWVSHGKNSGDNKTTSFSNKPGSLKSSLGVFVTDKTSYIGGKGTALRLKGLEPGFNSNAYSRSIVVHGAQYVNPDMIKKYGRVGRSWGCPAVSPNLVKPIINTIKDNTVIFAYYPDHDWLKNSQYLS